MKKREFWVSLFWALLGIGIAVKSFAYGIGTLRHPEPGFLPFWGGISIFILSLVSVVQSLKAELPTAPFWGQPESLRRMTTTFLLLLAYVFVVKKLGFLLSTFLLMGFLLKTIYPQSWRRTITFSVIVSILSYGLFGRWLKVQLPKGWMGF